MDIDIDDILRKYSGLCEAEKVSYLQNLHKECSKRTNTSNGAQCVSAYEQKRRLKSQYLELFRKIDISNKLNKNYFIG